MNVWTFLKASAGSMMLHGLLALLVTSYFVLLGAGWPNMITLWLIWLICVGSYYGWRYITMRNYYRRLFEQLQGLEQKYLLGSLGDAPPLLELHPLWEVLVAVSRSMHDEMARVEKEANAHREYVETWVHEVKAPLAAARLLSEQYDAARQQDLIEELNRVEQLVEQALFYARSSTVNQDYFVRETILEDVVNRVLRRYTRQFIANRVSVELTSLEKTVFTDRKWLEFILAQILTNAVKYRRDSGAKVHIFAEERDGGVTLSIEDNGIGIPSSDLDRIFDKGFTGAAGRKYSRSTGIGLYLARKLCLALGHRITAESEEGLWTRLIIYFPKGRLLFPSEPNRAD